MRLYDPTLPSSVLVFRDSSSKSAPNPIHFESGWNGIKGGADFLFSCSLLSFQGFAMKNLCSEPYNYCSNIFNSVWKTGWEIPPFCWVINKYKRESIKHLRSRGTSRTPWLKWCWLQRNAKMFRGVVRGFRYLSRGLGQKVVLNFLCIPCYSSALSCLWERFIGCE